MTSNYIANLRVPAQEMRLRVAPARHGVRLDLGERHLYLAPNTAIALANALADALETGQTEADECPPAH